MATDDPDPLDALSNSEFLDLAGRGFTSSQQIETYLREGITRGIDPEKLGEVFDQFIEECLLEVGNRYTQLFSLLGFDSGIDAYHAFVMDATTWLRNGRAPASVPPSKAAGDNPGNSFPDWPWPVTEPGTPTEPHGAEGWHGQESSGLWICGYRVGANGLPALERTRLLNFFFRNPLPEVVSRHCGEQYGEPGSEKRLRRMANVIARNCRTFKQRSRERYADAIDAWERDLAYLKKAYYHAGMFPWPLIEGAEDQPE